MYLLSSSAVSMLKLCSPLPPLGAIYRVTHEDATAVLENESTAPVAFGLSAPAPNPFNSETVLRFGLPRVQRVTLTIYDVLGRPVQTLAEEPLEPGSYTVTWNGRDAAGRPAASGVYFARLRAGESVLAQRLTLVR